jgi:hypothetical protein
MVAAADETWRVVTLPRVKPAEVSFVPGEGRDAVRIQAVAAAASAVRTLSPAASAGMVSWQWKVDRVVEGADLARREGDDYAARFYVTFDVPLEALPFATRARIRLARLFYGAEIPTAAICYVWDNTHPVGTSAWNAYTSQVRMVVLQSGGARAGQWVAERRDVAQDFRAAFGARHPGLEPRVSGIAVSADTDQTGEAVTAWFRDVALEARS